MYKHKIEGMLQEPNKFRFEEMNVLLVAYEFYKYENKNKQVFKAINEDFEKEEEPINSILNDSKFKR